jgi:hypothetical protein
MTVEEAADILDVLGSDQDPIKHAGVETTPRELGYSNLGTVDARAVRVWFWPINGDKMVCRTLRSMVLDRME